MSGKRGRADWTAFVVNGTRHFDRSFIAHVPNKPVEAHRIGQRASWRGGFGRISVANRLRLGLAGIVADHFALGVKNVEGNVALRFARERIIENHSVGRICANAGTSSEAKAGAAKTHCGSGLIQMHGSSESFGGHLAQRRDVIEGPETAP